MTNIVSDETEIRFRDLKQQSELHPLSIRTWISYGETAMQLCKAEEALYAFHQAQVIENNDILAITGSIAAHFSIGNSQAAYDLYDESKEVWDKQEQTVLEKQNRLQQNFAEIYRLSRPWERVLDLCGDRISYRLYTDIGDQAIIHKQELYYPLWLKLAQKHFEHDNFDAFVKSLESYEKACLNYTGSYNYDDGRAFSDTLDSIRFYLDEDSILAKLFPPADNNWIYNAETAMLEQDNERARAILEENLSHPMQLEASELYRCAILFFELQEENMGIYYFQMAYECDPKLFYSSASGANHTHTAQGYSIANYFDFLSESNPALYHTIEEFLKTNITTFINE